MQHKLYLGQTPPGMAQAAIEQIRPGAAQATLGQTPPGMVQAAIEQMRPGVAPAIL